MKKSWGMIPKILNGQKTIESRWYSVRSRPWDGIAQGEAIYFKNSGEPVTVKAEVKKVFQFGDLNEGKAKEILDKYGSTIGLEAATMPQFFEMIKHKQYCILIFLKNPRAINPFEIKKKGFGAMSAWISVDAISAITIKNHGN